MEDQEHIVFNVVAEALFSLIARRRGVGGGCLPRTSRYDEPPESRDCTPLSHRIGTNNRPSSRPPLRYPADPDLLLAGILDRDPIDDRDESAARLVAGRDDAGHAVRGKRGSVDA